MSPRLLLPHLPPVFVLHPSQQPELVEKYHSRENARARRCHDECNFGGPAKLALLGAVDVGDRGEEAGESIQKAGDKNLIEEPDIIRHPPPPQPHHTRCSNSRADKRNNEQRNMRDSLQHRTLQLIRYRRRGTNRLRLLLLPTRERTGKQQEPSQQDPREERREEVPVIWYVVEGKEHVDVAGAMVRCRAPTCCRGCVSCRVLLVRTRFGL